MTDIPAFSVIVPVYNNGLELEQCLASIRATDPSYQVEIIVVDDCSPNDGELIQLISEKYGATYKRLQANGGPGVARNQGALLAKGEILLFIDADCVAPQQWISNLTNPIRMGQCVATTSCYCGPVLATWLTIFQNEDYSYRMPTTKCDSYFVNSCNFAIERQTFLGFDGFPIERVGEDARLGITLAEHGKPARYLPDVGVFHNYHRSLRGYLKQRYSFAFSGFRIVLRHDKLMSNQSTQKVRSYNPIRVILGMFFAFLVITSLFLAGIVLVIGQDLYPYFMFSTVASLTAWATVHGHFFLFLYRKQGIMRAISYLFLQILIDAVYLSAFPKGIVAALFPSNLSATGRTCWQLALALLDNE
jgi:glycosyltransferase involved in cell wall biosynthesis